MKTLILNTIEVVDVPEVALAAPEDLVDSRERLAELIAWIERVHARHGGALKASPRSDATRPAGRRMECKICW